MHISYIHQQLLRVKSKNQKPARKCIVLLSWLTKLVPHFAFYQKISFGLENYCQFFIIHRRSFTFLLIAQFHFKPHKFDCSIRPDSTFSNKPHSKQLPFPYQVSPDKSATFSINSKTVFGQLRPRKVYCV